ncbi:MAG TPA: pyridoxamine 5'-phosphate oxidase family protein [Ktedonobacteraceae bacterium]|nr:pyridoxamine 5'-phosphate oxidase family protein [Ktedonobacteraceae bacterium]
MRLDASLPQGQNEARTRWNTHASGAEFDKKKVAYLTPQAQTFISQQVLCVLAGQGTRSEPRGLIVMGLPGFVATPDEHTCLLPIDRRHKTSHLLLGLLQAQQLGRVAQLGLCFIRHTTRERLCVQGSVELLPEDESDIFWIRLHVQQAFFHCAKYIRTNIPGLTAPAVSHLHPAPSSQLVDDGQTSLSRKVQSFIARQIVCFLCTVDREGTAAVNHRGGAAGFLISQAPSAEIPGGMMLLPDYTGNGAFEALGNILETRQAALVIPGYVDQLALCIGGDAFVLESDELLPEVRRKCVGARRVIALYVQYVEQQTDDWSAPLALEFARSQSGQELGVPGLSCTI